MEADAVPVSVSVSVSDTSAFPVSVSVSDTSAFPVSVSVSDTSVAASVADTSVAASVADTSVAASVADTSVAASVADTSADAVAAADASSKLRGSFNVELGTPEEVADDLPDTDTKDKTVQTLKHDSVAVAGDGVGDEILRGVEVLDSRIFMPKLLIQIIGFSQGNPGPSGAGAAFIVDNDFANPAFLYREGVGFNTTIIADIRALLSALKKAEYNYWDSFIIETPSPYLLQEFNSHIRYDDFVGIEDAHNLLKDCGSRELDLLCHKAKCLVNTFGRIFFRYASEDNNILATNQAIEAVALLDGQVRGGFV